MKRRAFLTATSTAIGTAAVGGAGLAATGTEQKLSRCPDEIRINPVSSEKISIYFPASDGTKYRLELSVVDTIAFCSTLNGFLLMLLRNATPAAEVAGDIESKSVMDNLARGQGKRGDRTG